MSHLVKVDVKVDNTEALKQSLEEMGYEVREGQHTLSAWGWKMNCDFSIKKNGRQLMVGFKELEDGTIKIEADWYGTGIGREKFQEDLNQLHSKHKTVNIVRKKGWKLGKEKVLEDGTIEIRASRWM